MNTNWLNTTEYPFSPHYFSINGQRLHYIDEGQGETLLFVHGTPSWSFDFRNVIKQLKDTYRCIALDHIGFGLSDKPQQYDYSTLNHSNTLQAFVQHLQLDNITLVVHDFGGPIGLNFAIHNPNKVKRLIVLNSWLWSSRGDADYIKLSRILKSPLLPFLYRYLNFSPRFILPQSFGDKKLGRRLKKQYTRPFANSTQREGALAFARSLLNDQGWFEDLWNKRNAIAGKPTLFIWGMKDPVIKPHYLEKFLSAFSDSRVLRLQGAGHFPQEEEPLEISKAIVEWMKNTG